MNDNKGVAFEDILNQQQTWTNYSDFCDNIPQIIADEVERNAISTDRLINDLKRNPKFKELTVKNVDPDLAKAQKLLSDGKVVGVDGTMAKYNLLSGIRCQIGVVAANYHCEQIKHSFFISQASLHEETEEVLARILQRVDKSSNLSDMHLRGIMLYREREAGMSDRFKGKYILYHGPLLPFELMSGLGHLRALNFTLDLLKKMVTSKRIMSVISTTTLRELTYFGLAIENKQYLTHDDWNLEYHISNTNDFVAQKEKWRVDELEKVEDFLKDYASQIQIGVIRISERPYVFQAHKEIFELAAAIIARDSMFQKEKGFPLLIDYADSLCTQYFSKSEFTNMMEWELAKTNTYLRESEERKMRMK